MLSGSENPTTKIALAIASSQLHLFLLRSFRVPFEEHLIIVELASFLSFFHLCCSQRFRFFIVVNYFRGS